MNRTEFESYIAESYGITGDQPWGTHSHTVYRHPSTQKWFAVVMNIPKRLLGIKGKDNIDVVNLKCDPAIVCDLTAEEGIFPAYHMNKTHWITVALDTSKDNETVKWLLNLSYDLTRKK